MQKVKSFFFRFRTYLLLLILFLLKLIHVHVHFVRISKCIIPLYLSRLWEQKSIISLLVYTFHIHREMYHKIGTLLPDDPETQPQFAQIYIYNTDHEIQNRSNVMPGLDSTIFAELQRMLHNINPYVNIFRQVRNILT